MIFMSAKSVRNLILTLIILIIGIFILVRIGKGFTGTSPFATSTQNLIASIDSLSNMLILGLVIIVIILIPIYLSRRSEEKKIKEK